MMYRKLPLFSVALLSAAFFWACKEDPNPRTMAQTEAQDDSARQAHAKLKAKVRKSLGEADLQRKSAGDWSHLRIGQSVVEHDRIRTGAESEAVLSVSDGSALWITELSEVTLDVEIFDSLSRQVSVVVNNGGVVFDVQKQKLGNSIKFRTNTATAAIRGTAGFVFTRDGQTVASLKEGLVDVNGNAGGEASIGARQTVLIGQDGKLRTLNLRSSGTRSLSMVLANVNIFGEGPHADSLEQALEAFDKDYSDRADAFEKKLTFRANPQPDTLWAPSATLQARVNPGVIVTVLGETDTVGENGVYQHTFEWDEKEYGTKRFMATCSDGEVEVQCFTWTVQYGAPAAPAAVDTAAVDTAAATDSAAAAAAEQAAAEKAAADKAAAEKAAKDKEQLEKAKIKEAADKAKAAAKDDAKAKEQAKPAEEKKASKNVNVSVKLAGGKTERKHLDLPANEYKTSLKFSLAGITDADLSEIASVTVKRKGEVVQSFNNISGLNYEVPVSIDLNTIAKYDIEVALKNGKKVRTTKTYEVFCFRRNHMGKARNCVQYDKVDGGGCDPSHAEEYEAVKGQLKED